MKIIFAFIVLNSFLVSADEKCIKEGLQRLSSQNRNLQQGDNYPVSPLQQGDNYSQRPQVRDSQQMMGGTRRSSSSLQQGDNYPVSPLQQGDNYRPSPLQQGDNYSQRPQVRDSQQMMGEIPVRRGTAELRHEDTSSLAGVGPRREPQTRTPTSSRGGTAELRPGSARPSTRKPPSSRGGPAIFKDK